MSRSFNNDTSVFSLNDLEIKSAMEFSLPEIQTFLATFH